MDRKLVNDQRFLVEDCCVISAANLKLCESMSIPTTETLNSRKS